MSTAASIMTRNVFSILEKTTIKEYLQQVQERSFSGCPVVDAEGFAVGFVSQSDVLRGLTAMLSGAQSLEGKQRRQLTIALLLTGKPVADATFLFERFLSMRVTEIMSKGVYSCHTRTPIAEVCEALSRLRIHRLIVVDEFGKVTGIISSLDALRFCSQEMKGLDNERPTLRNFPPINEDAPDKETSD